MSLQITTRLIIKQKKMRKYLLVLAFGFGALLTTHQVQAATLATGQVRVNNANVSAGWVELVGNNLYAGAEISNGQFTINSDTAFTSGAYILRAIPDTSAYPQNGATEVNVNYTGSAINQTITLSAASKEIQVTVSDSNGSPVSVTAFVKASGGGAGMRFAQTTTNGRATFSGLRPEGAPYTVSFDNCVQANDGSQTCANWLYTGDPISVSFTQPATTAEIQQVTVQGESSTATVTGTITYENQGFEGFIHLYDDTGLYSGWMEDNGQFTVYAKPGSYKIDLLPHQSIENPDVVRYYIDNATIGGAITVVEGTNDIGTLAASFEDATITAHVQDESGNPIDGVDANFWLAGGGEWRKITLMAGTGGSIGSEAHEGTYFVNAVDPTGTYFPAAAQEVVVEAGGTPEVTLTMVRANAALSLTVLNDDASRAATFNSFVNCWDTTNNRGNGVDITRGAASLSLVAGTYTCTGMTPLNADASLAPIEITVEAGSTAVASATLVDHDAVVSGTLEDQNGGPIVPATDAEKPLVVVLEGETYGRFEVEVEADGTWSKDLPPDTYTVSPDGEEIIPVLGKEAATITVAAGETSEQSVETFAGDAVISTQVFEPDGETPLPFAPVTCTFLPEGEKGDFPGGRVIEVVGETDENGEVTIPVLSEDGGVALTYDCAVSVSEDDGLIAPALKEVTPGDSVDFTVVEPDSTITVSYAAAGDAVDFDAVQCQAWAKDGSGTVTALDEDADGEVELQVSEKAGAQWDVSCSGTSDDTVFTPTEPKTVEVTEPGSFDTSLQVEESAVNVPQGSSQSFDGTAEKQLQLDGVEVTVPANTIESGGDVTLTITPTATDTPKNEDNLLATVPLNVQAFDDDGNVQTDFANPVTLTIPYDESVLAEQGLIETDLVPKFFNESGGTWETVAGYQLDTEAQTITFSTTHFTQFALLYNGKVAGSAPGKVKNVTVPTKALHAEQAKIKWKNVTDAETYQVKLLNKKGEKIKLFKNVDANSLVIKKKWLNPNKTYKVRVRAVGSNGLYGEWSKVKSFTTLEEAVE